MLSMRPVFGLNFPPDADLPDAVPGFGIDQPDMPNSGTGSYGNTDANPFAQAPPKQVRAVLWEYWMTDLATKRATGRWWRREDRGLYAPSLEEGSDGKVIVTAWPEAPPPLP